MSAPLSNRQKFYLSSLARRAWAKLGPELDGMDEDDFRHDQVARACGKLGLRCCSQDDYRLVEAHLLDRRGESGRAMKSLVQGQSNPRRIAEYKLHQACRDAGVDIAYADRICRAMFKCAVADATADQLWKLTFTVKNRGRKVTFEERRAA
jgi:uncharacterized protein YifE (UPF0438 family)